MKNVATSTLPVPPAGDHRSFSKASGSAAGSVPIVIGPAGTSTKPASSPSSAVWAWEGMKKEDTKKRATKTRKHEKEPATKARRHEAAATATKARKHERGALNLGVKRA